MKRVEYLEGRDAELARVMAVSIRTLTSEFEFLDLAHQLAVSTTQLLDAGAAGVMLEDTVGNLQVLSASDEDTRLLEVFELQRKEGPCYECWKFGITVSAPDMLSMDRWAQFVEEARDLGFVSAIAVPLRLRSQVIGALNVFWSTHRVATEGEIDAAQALADVAVVGLVQQQLTNVTGLLAEQLESAIHSRAMIEQAKGIVASKAHVTISQAADIIQAFSAEQCESIVTVAQAVVDRRVIWQDNALRPV